eukprot:gene13047-15414_t
MAWGWRTLQLGEDRALTLPHRLLALHWLMAVDRTLRETRAAPPLPDVTSEQPSSPGSSLPPTSMADLDACVPPSAVRHHWRQVGPSVFDAVDVRMVKLEILAWCAERPEEWAPAGDSALQEVSPAVVIEAAMDCMDALHPGCPEAVLQVGQPYPVSCAASSSMGDTQGRSPKTAPDAAHVPGPPAEAQQAGDERVAALSFLCTLLRTPLRSCTALHEVAHRRLIGLLLSSPAHFVPGVMHLLERLTGSGELGQAAIPPLLAAVNVVLSSDTAFHPAALADGLGPATSPPPIPSLTSAAALGDDVASVLSMPASTVAYTPAPSVQGGGGAASRAPSTKGPGPGSIAGGGRASDAASVIASIAERTASRLPAGESAGAAAVRAAVMPERGTSLTQYLPLVEYIAGEEGVSPTALLSLLAQHVLGCWGVQAVAWRDGELPPVSCLEQWTQGAQLLSICRAAIQVHSPMRLQRPMGQLLRAMWQHTYDPDVRDQAGRYHRMLCRVSSWEYTGAWEVSNVALLALL